MKPILSVWVQRATIWPPAKRSMVIPTKVKCLPVAGTPITSAVWMPLKVQRQTTLSPTAAETSRRSARRGELTAKIPVGARSLLLFNQIQALLHKRPDELDQAGTLRSSVNQL